MFGQTVNGEKQEFFNDREKAHMVDVQNLFLGGLTLRFSAIIGLGDFVEWIDFHRRGTGNGFCQNHF